MSTLTIYNDESDVHLRQVELDTFPDSLDYQVGVDKRRAPLDDDVIALDNLDNAFGLNPNGNSKADTLNKLTHNDVNANVDQQKEHTQKQEQGNRPNRTDSKHVQIVNIPRNRQEQQENKLMFEQDVKSGSSSSNRAKRVDLHRDPEESARLLAEYNDKMRQRHAPKTTTAPPARRTVPPYDDKRMEYALRQYQVAVQKDKRNSHAAAAARVETVVAREDHLRVVKHEQVLVARVEHDVLGNYEPPQRAPVKGPG